MTKTDSTDSAVRAWFAERLPEEWTGTAPDVTVDREEITVVLTLPQPPSAEGASEADRAAAQAGRINQFREDTRQDRIRVARQIEHRYQRKVAWGVRCGDTNELFTHLAAPVMTRLRQPERQILDTLVDAGVARSRSEALAWCVKLVGQNTDAWLADLRNAMTRVDELRKQGPNATN